jgi:predicted MFS family arabinose efflux permease
MSQQTVAAPIDHEQELDRGFSRYQSRLIAILALVQFTVIVDFIIMSPLGAILLPALDITAGQFGVAVSAYAFSAGISGVLAAGFADRFDRKRLLLFFYVGFTAGTALCALAPNYHLLLLGRVVTGLFGGVVGSVVLAIITDLFSLHLRGRVMGYVQTAFAASQVLGIPVGLFLANRWSWHVAFAAIVGLALAVIAAVLLLMRPVNAHLLLKQERNAFSHLLATVSEPSYSLAFGVTTLLATGGYMLMPFGSAYTVHNLGIDIVHLPTIYLVSGLFAIFTGPLVGRASDAFGKFPTFMFGTVMSIVMVLIYTHLGAVTLTTAIAVNVLMFVGIFSRMIPSQALISAIPAAHQRGSFSAISASLQQLSGGLGSVFAAAIIAQNADGSLGHFDHLGYVVVGTAILALVMMFFVQRQVARKTALAI